PTRRDDARGGAPLPLPVRGARAGRPNPAEAVPGIRPDDRHIVAENAEMPPTPRNSVVRGTMTRPQLPRRRAQEHIAPQLRDGPLPRQDTEHVAGHDPGLMAAFQRGIGMAESQRTEAPADRPHPVHPDSGRPDPGRPAPESPDALPPLRVVRVDRPSPRSPHLEGHLDVPPLGAVRTSGDPRGTARPTAPDPGQDPAPHTERAPGPDTGQAPAPHTAHASAPPDAQPTRDTGPRPGPDRTARHDGSAPAG
ncbi:ATP-binding protein, partial [Streptomyces sp. NPDC006875]